MNYRDIFIEFLYEYREYCPNTVQLIILEQNNNNGLLNYFYQLEDIHVFSAKGTQVFYKKRTFGDVQNTVVELAIIDDLPRVYSACEVAKCVDIYNNESIEQNYSKYVFVKPIINDMSIKAVLVVYSDTPIEWMINDNKLLKLSDALQKSLSNSIYEEVNSITNSPYWMLKGKEFYLSKELKEYTKLETAKSSDDLSGFGLKLINSTAYLDKELLVYELNNIPQVLSLFELYNLTKKEYTLIYLESDDNENNDSFYEKIVKALTEIDGKLGKYNIYQVDLEHFVIIYDEIHSKKSIEQYFAAFKYIIVRSGNEIKSKVDFKLLIEYLVLSPIEEFNLEYYKYFCDNYYIEKVNSVLEKTSNSKIKIIPIFDSLHSSKKGYLIKDIGNINLFDKKTKQKSLLSLLKIADEYKDEFIYLEIPLSYIFEGQKLSISVLNKIRSYLNNNVDRCFIITNYSKLLNKIYAHWPEFNKYLYFYDIPANLYESFLSIKEGNGLYINSLEYRKFFDSNNIMANTLIKFILHESKKLLINVKQTDIIKYQEENLLLVCE